MTRYLFVIFTIFLIGCGNSGGSDSPMNSVTDFVSAVKEGNYDKAWGQLNEKSQKFYDDMSRGREYSGREIFEKNNPTLKSLGILGTNFIIADQKQEEDFATVIIITENGKTSNIYTEKEGNTWKLDYIKSVQESINQEEK